MAISTRFAPDRSGGASLPRPFQLVTGDTGDVTIPAGSGTVYITKLTAATDLVLDSPSSDIDGALLEIFNVAGAAHVVSYEPGFNGDPEDDGATFDATIGTVLTLRALSGVWYVDLGSSNGVTLTSDGGD